MRIKNNRFLNILFAFILCISFSVSTFANNTYPTETTKILQEITQLKTENGELYNIIIIPEEELQYYLDAFNNLSLNQKNTLPNLVAFSYTTSSYYVSMKATNIAVDSLDYLSGNIDIYNKDGLCGSGIFSFYNIPPLKSEYMTTRSQYGAWDTGIMFATASDGSKSNRGTFYFSK